MARRKQTRGKCVFCAKEMTKGGISKHLKTCPARQIKNADGVGEPENIYHLQVQDAWGLGFWLHLEMRESAKLKDLDHYLREIWLECCGHLSQFNIGGAWSGQKIAMTRTANQVFSPGMEFTHIYDFGTTSETTVKVVDVRVGKPLSKKPIYLMARNDIPEAICMECEKKAAWLCIECIYEDEESGWLCDDHVDDHPHDDYGEPIPAVNSPRLGMCGYSGPSDPPY